MWSELYQSNQLNYTKWTDKAPGRIAFLERTESLKSLKKAKKKKKSQWYTTEKETNEIISWRDVAFSTKEIYTDITKISITSNGNTVAQN
jgi:hypothetical protein